MFEIRLHRFTAPAKLACELTKPAQKPHTRCRGGLCALALCFAGISAFATGASAAEVSSLAGFPTPTLTLNATAPVLSLSGQTVRWSAVGQETYYEIAISNAPRGTAGRTTAYLSVPRQPSEPQTYTPTLQPGQTVYVGVSADNGPNWSVAEATVSAPAPEPPTPEAPLLSVQGTTVSWTAVPGVSSYTFATVLNPTTTRNTTYTVVKGTSYTPPAVPGETVNYGLSASVPGQAPWAQEITITYPPTPPPPTPTPVPTPPPSPTPPPPIPLGKIIGTNDGAGWGEAPAHTILAGHITWNRVELGAPWNTIPRSLSYGFKVLAITGNLADATPLNQIDPNQWGSEVASEILANPGIAIAEAGNEMYYKGGVADPVQYGKMYLAAIHAMSAAGIHIPLLFNMWGDYPMGSYASASGYSRDANGGGWLRDAVSNVPGLAAAILANGLSSHPYGGLSENYDDEGGVAAVTAQEAVAQAVLGSVPPFYITEFGYAMSRCGAPEGACSQQDQATKMRAAYSVMLADPHVAGIWWYESHDDSNGEFGYMNSDNTTRISFNVLSSIAQEQGQ
jgi:hypothetical protein